MSRTLSTLRTLRARAAGLLVTTLVLAGASSSAWAAPPTATPAWGQKKSEGLTPGGEKSVDLQNGAFQHELPIAVPAFHNLEPELSMSYSSAAGNGFLGIGWSLDGFSVIERVGANGNGSRSCNADDAYTLDGAPLVPCTTLGGTHCSKTQTYARIHFDASAERWEVWEKDGTKSTYTKIFHVSGGTIGASCPYRYGVTSREDPSGNRVTYEWTTDAPGGAQEVYPSAIRYNGVTVRLFPELRPDPITYANGVDATNQRQRLRSILVSVDSSGAAGGGVAAKLRAYRLTYTTSPSTGRSRLASVTEYGRDVVIDAAGAISGGVALRTHGFTYAGGSAGFAHLVSWSGYSNGNGYDDVSNYATIRTPDIDGDGKADVCARANAGIYCYRYTGEGWASFANIAASPALSDALGWNKPEYYSTIQFPDLNGDGKADVCARGVAGLSCWLNNGAASPGFTIGVPRPTYSNGTAYFADAQGWDKPEYYGSIRFADVNGDGNDDVCARSSTGIFCRLMNASGTAWGGYVDGPSWSDANGWKNADNLRTVQFADVNGDGKADVCGRANSGIICAFSTGTDFGPTWYGPAWSDANGWSNAKYYATISFADVNGDGKADVCGRAADGMHCHLAIGSARTQDKGAFDAQAIVFATLSNDNGWDQPKYYETIQFADVNGDGKSDVCWRASTGIGCARSTGTGFTSVVSNSPAWTNANGWDDVDNYSTIRFVDMDGDGKADLFGRTNSGLQIYETNGDGREHVSAITSNGSGGTMSITYAPSSSFPRVNNPPIGDVVTRLVIGDGRGGTSTYGFSYAGEKFDRANQRSLGFRDVKRSLPRLAGETIAPAEELWFMQEPYGCVGLVDFSKRFGGAGQLLTYTESSYVATGSGAGPFTCLLQSTAEHLYDGSGNTTCTAIDNTHCKRTDIGYEYDAHGNTVRTYDYGDFFSADDDTTQAITYATNDAAYVVDTARSERSYAGIGVGGELLTETQTAYDGAGLDAAPVRGLPTLERTWVSRRGGSDPQAAYVDTRKGFDAYGNQIWSEDALGYHSDQAYDPVFHVFEIATTNPLGQTTATEWDPVCGKALVEIDANGQSTRYGYDDHCRLTRKDEPLGGFEVHIYSPLGDATQQYERTETPAPAGVAGNLYELRYFDGLARTYRTQSRGPDDAADDDIVTETTFDARGHERTRTIPRYEGAPAKALTFDYDELDRPTKISNADGSSETSRYELWTRITVDEAGRQSARTVDAHERLTRLAEKDGELWNAATYGYDARGNLVRTVDPSGNVTTCGYNSVGQKLEETDPDRGSSQYSYDPDGRLASTTDARGRTALVTYDALGRVLTRTLDAGGGAPDVTSYRYDEERAGFFERGELTTMTDAAGTATYAHDAAGRLVEESRSLDGQTYIFQYQLDPGDRVTGTRYPDGDSVGDDPTTLAAEPALVYDGAGRLRAIPGYVDDVSYSATGAITRLTDANGVVSTRGYSAERDTLDSMKTVRGQEVLQDSTFTRDPEGKILGIASPRAADRWTYSYDELARLRTAMTLARPDENNAWTYDKLGNLLTSPWVASYMYPVAGAPRPHAPLAAGGTSFGYDAAGNMISAGDRRYTWDGASRLARVEEGAHVTTYAYDGDGTRVKKVYDGVETVYPHDGYEVGPGGTTKYLRIGGELVAKKVDAHRFWLHANHIDSIAFVTDESGAEVKRTLLAPYGQVLESTGEHIEVYGFSGQREDENELVFMNARYYDPQLGLFLSPDSETPDGRIVGLNRYAYAQNDPVNYTDPTGHVPWGWLGKIATTTGAGILGTFVCGPPCAFAFAVGAGTAYDIGMKAYHHKEISVSSVSASLAGNTFDEVVGLGVAKVPGVSKLGTMGGKAIKNRLRPRSFVDPVRKAFPKGADGEAAYQAARRPYTAKRRWWGNEENQGKVNDSVGDLYTAFPEEFASSALKDGGQWQLNQWRQPRRPEPRAPRRYVAPSCFSPGYRPPRPRPRPIVYGPFYTPPPPRRSGGGGCFVAGTQVAMADGSQKAIDEIRVGDVVLAFDQTTQKVVPSPVLEVYVHEHWAHEAGTVLVNGRLRATDNHPFFVNGAWQRADTLHGGDWLFSLDRAGGAQVTPEPASSVVSMDGVDTVYNLEIATYHTYFAEGVLVHNMKTANF